jgi:hypothetical protein
MMSLIGAKEPGFMDSKGALTHLQSLDQASTHGIGPIISSTILNVF